MSNHDDLHINQELEPISDIAREIHDDPVQPINHTFPTTSFGNRYRSFNPKWFDQYVWIEYSISRDDTFCYPCRFIPMGSHTHRVEDSFVNSGYRDWKHATGKHGGFVKHDTSLKHKCARRPGVMHKHAMASWSDYKRNLVSTTSIASTLDSTRRQLVLQNRCMKSIIEVLLFCASQDVDVRGHREGSSDNRGNFLELLDLVAKYNPVIKARLCDGPKNAVYTSSGIQNELLHILAERVWKVICQAVRGAGFFSILADETRDAGKQEQMSFVVRYVSGSDDDIHEHFLTYVRSSCC